MSDFAVKLQDETIGCRLAKSKFGASKALERGHQDRAADLFEARASELTARKRVIAKGNKAWKDVVSILGDATRYWQSVSVPYPEDGVRLIRKSSVSEFVDQMAKYRIELASAVVELDAALELIKAERREALGQLFNPADYPETFADSFDLSWSFPVLEPSEHLKKISPKLYEEERSRVNAEFTKAIAMAEEAFATELKKLLEQVANKIANKADTKKAVLDEKVFAKLKTFVDRFKSLNCGSNAELQQLVEQAQGLVGGSVGSKGKLALEDVASEFGKLSQNVDEVVVIKSRKVFLQDEATDAVVDAVDAA